MKLHCIAACAALLAASAATAGETPVGGHAQLPPGITLDDVANANAARSTAAARAPGSFGDVQFWVGTGANQAALVIDFNDGKTNEAFLWGYRWDGAATAEDMVRDVVDTDPYLLWFESAPGAFGVSVFGMGYDEDHDGGAFSYGGVLSPPATGPWTSTGADDVGNGPTDADDHFKSAWLSGNFWGLVLSANNGSTWTGAMTGISGETLDNGEWIGMTFGGFPSPDPASWVAATAPSSSVDSWSIYD